MAGSWKRKRGRRYAFSAAGPEGGFRPGEGSQRLGRSGARSSIVVWSANPDDGLEAFAPTWRIHLRSARQQVILQLRMVALDPRRYRGRPQGRIQVV